jgi:hypothetical protein
MGTEDDKCIPNDAGYYEELKTMIPNMDESVKKAIESLLMRLVHREYDQVEMMTGGNRLTSEEIAEAIADYGRTLTFPSVDLFGLKGATATEVIGSPTNGWFIVLPLWTEEEGESDLSIEITAIKTDRGITLELDSIHVL